MTSVAGSSERLPVQLVCLDLAGTTVADGDAVAEALAVALDPGDGPDGLVRVRGFIEDTMGWSKIDVMRSWYGEEERARRANAAFEEAYAALIEAGRCTAIPSAEETVQAIRSAGAAVAFVTGFSPATRDRLLDRLGWRELADVALSPADAGRGRPFPDMVLAAMLRTGADDVAAVAVVGDTASDIESGRRAGAAHRIGVLTGEHDASRLRAAGATAVCGSVAGVPALIGIPELAPSPVAG